MAKFLLPIIIVLVFFAGGFFLYQNFQTKPASQLTSTPQTINTPKPTESENQNSLPSLFSEIEWVEPQQRTFSNEDSYNPQHISGVIIESESKVLTGKILDKIMNYYVNYFNNQVQGWEMYLSADGPTGSLNGWRKGGKYFIVDVTVDPVKRIGAATLKYN